MTEWRRSPSHPDLDVSSCGLVRHRATGRTHGGTDGGKVGYKQFRYHQGGKERRPYVHRLVCEAFHGPAPNGKPYALHNGDVRHDNSAANLRWGDASENAREWLDAGNRQTPGTVPDLATIHGYMSAGLSFGAIARLCGCGPDAISRKLRRASV